MISFNHSQCYIFVFIPHISCGLQASCTHSIYLFCAYSAAQLMQFCLSLIDAYQSGSCNCIFKCIAHDCMGSSQLHGHTITKSLAQLWHTVYTQYSHVTALHNFISSTYSDPQNHSWTFLLLLLKCICNDFHRCCEGCQCIVVVR